MEIINLYKDTMTAEVKLNKMEYEAMEKILYNKTKGFRFTCLSELEMKESFEKLRKLVRTESEKKV